LFNIRLKVNDAIEHLETVRNKKCSDRWSGFKVQNSSYS